MTAPSPDDLPGLVEAVAEARHDPTWLNAGSVGRWCVCSCGWESHAGTVSFAQAEFGNHLLEQKREMRP